MINVIIGLLISGEVGEFLLNEFKDRDNKFYDLKLNYYFSQREENKTWDKIANINLLPKKNERDLLRTSGIVIVDYTEDELVEFLKTYQDSLQEKLVIFTEKIKPEIVNKYINLYINLIPVIDDKERLISFLLVKNEKLSEELWDVLLEEMSKVFRDFKNIEVVFFEEVDKFMEILKTSQIYILKLLTMMTEKLKLQGYSEEIITRLLLISNATLINNLKEEGIVYLEQELEKTIATNKELGNSLEKFDELNLDKIFDK